MENLVCSGIQFNMFFDPFPNIRDHAQKIERDFHEFFPSGFTIFPNQAIIPMEVPRFAGNSEKGEYSLTVTGVNANFTQNINENNDKLIDLMENFNIIINKLYDNIIDIHPVHKILFCGITVLLKYSVKGNATSFIKDKFIKLNDSDDFYDIATRFTYTTHDKYYINISVNNIRNKQLESDGIQIQIDINDRYRLNRAQEKNSYSENNIQNILTNLMVETINNKIKNLFTE